MSRESREARREYHERMEKETQRLLRRVQKLSDNKFKHTGELFELETPIFDGWEREFKVRDDIARSPEGPDLQRVLEFVQCKMLRSNKKFIVRTSKRRKEYKPIVQELETLSEKSFEKVPDDLKKYFYKYEKQFSWGGPRMVWGVIHPWKFEFVIKKHYRTHVPVTSSELDSEYERVSNKLWNHDMLAFKYGSARSRGAEEKSWRTKQRAKDREEERRIINAELEEYLDDKHWEELDSYSPW